MRVASVLLAAVLAVGFGFAQTPTDAPTQTEMVRAYRSGRTGVRLLVAQWERRHVNEIRGWSVRFKELKHEQKVGVSIATYQGLAKKNGTCVEYQISDTMPIPANPQIRPNLVVEPGALVSCP